MSHEGTRAGGIQHPYAERKTQCPDMSDITRTPPGKTGPLTYKTLKVVLMILNGNTNTGFRP